MSSPMKPKPTDDQATVGVWLEPDPDSSSALAWLFRWPVEKLDEVITTISKWGLDGEQPDLTGEFRLDDGVFKFVLTRHNEE